MRTFAIGDIHGGLKALQQLVKRLKIRPNDTFIFLGDYVDGWSESAQVVQFLIEFQENNSCVFIKGNHDVWCENWLKTGEKNGVWLAHGGTGTVDSYKEFSDEQKAKHLEFFETLTLYHLDEANRLFLHAGFTSMHGVSSETHPENFYFDRTLWEMALTMDKRIKPHSEFYPNRLKHYDEIYIGHTPTLNYKQFDPMNAINVWNVDTGAAFFGKLSAIEINSKEVIQSNTVWDFYPNEMGRNKSKKF